MSPEPRGYPQPVLEGNDGHAGTGQRLARQSAARTIFVLFLVAPLPWVIVYFLPPINHDAAALLHFASRWLAGERLYVDLVDINPPLIFVLNLIPAAIDRLTPINGPTALTLCTLGWIAIGFALFWRLLDTRAEPAGSLRRYLMPPLMLFLMIAYPGTEFAQREQLMIVAALPYLLLAEARMTGTSVPRRLMIATALFAGFGYALKPHFLLIPVLVEACVLTAVGWRRLVRDPVPWLMVLLFALYALFIVAVTPRYLDSVVPLAMNQYLTLGGLGAWGVLLKSQLNATAILFVPLAAAALVVARPLAKLAAVASIAGIVIAMVQAKGWPYHLLPAETFVVLLAAILLCDLGEAQLPATDPRRGAAKILLLASFMLGAYYVSGLTRPTFLRHAGFDQSQAGQLVKRFGHELARGPVLILSPGIYPHFPVINYTGSTLAMRFMTLWPIQGAYASCLGDGQMFRSPAQMPAPEAWAFNAVVDDFDKFRPRLVIVDKIPGIPRCGTSEFDFLEYFRQSPRFDGYWQDYRLLAEYDRYRIYIRH